jgi:hypothetical protein
VWLQRPARRPKLTYEILIVRGPMDRASRLRHRMSQERPPEIRTVSPTLWNASPCGNPRTVERIRQQEGRTKVVGSQRGGIVPRALEGVARSGKPHDVIDTRNRFVHGRQGAAGCNRDRRT